MVSRYLIQRALARNQTSSRDFFQYNTNPTAIAQAGGLAAACLAASILAHALADGSGAVEASRSVREVKSVLELQQPFAVIGIGAASGILAPYVEERIYRGVILQGLMPYTGPALSVCSTVRSVILLIHKSGP